MRCFVRVLSLPLAALLLLGCGVMPARGETVAVIDEPEDYAIRVRKVEDLPDDFILGVDLSSVLSLEESGVSFFGWDGREQDVFKTLAQSGVTHIRVRVWNHPFDGEGHGFGGGNCDAARAVEIGRRAARYGLKLIVDFHYSDFWADPGKQQEPLAWKGMKIKEKSDALCAYTLDVLKQMKRAGVTVDLVQVGNETNGFLCGETSWENIAALMQAGAKAVRKAFPKARVAVHFANPERSGAYSEYARRLDEYKVDYDVFASSYYPFWHGTLENLSRTLGTIAETYGKQVMVMETSYAYTAADSDFFANTIGEGSEVAKPYPYTVQGQADSLCDVIDTVAHTRGGVGVCYWEAAWITVGGTSWKENSALWEEHGSGWASSYAAAYDPEDAGKWYGGSAVDNQALFDPQGRPLDSLLVFTLVRRGGGMD